MGLEKLFLDRKATFNFKYEFFFQIISSKNLPRHGNTKIASFLVTVNRFTLLLRTC